MYQRSADGSLGRLVLFMSYLAAALQYYASLPIAHMGQGWFLPVVPLLVESKRACDYQSVRTLLGTAVNFQLYYDWLVTAA